MFFAENYYGVDDGILASAKLIEIAARSPEPLSARFDAIPHLHATPELKAPCPDAEKFRVVEELARHFKGRYETIDIDGVRILFPGGWGLVRPSNTNPYLTLRFEARTNAELEAMKRIVFDALARYPFQGGGASAVPRLRGWKFKGFGDTGHAPGAPTPRSTAGVKHPIGRSSARYRAFSVSVRVLLAMVAGRAWRRLSDGGIRDDARRSRAGDA
jgi:hypothetical protein